MDQASDDVAAEAIAEGLTDVGAGRGKFNEIVDDLIAQGDSLFVEPLAAQRRQSGPDYGAQFLEIVQFQDLHGRPPERRFLTPDSSPEEVALVARLERLRSLPERCEQLRDLDKHGVLLSCPIDSPPLTLDEMIAAGDPLLETPDDYIFETRHVTPATERSDPDQIAERRPCRDFRNFKPIFHECVTDIQNGLRETVPTNATQQIAKGDMFILNGSMAYVAEVGAPNRGGEPNNPRLRVVYDNGTESDHLLRSFGKALYRDGTSRRVVNPEAGGLFEGGVAAAPSGRVYLARTLSNDPALADIRDHMVKIGSTKGLAEDRIRAAENDPTFLLASAKIVAEFEVTVVPAYRIERLLHRFFRAACISIRIPGRFGRDVDPREWFMTRPETVSRAVSLVTARRLHLYRYAVQSDEIVPNNPTAGDQAE